jgi:hypothetical protein
VRRIDRIRRQRRHTQLKVRRRHRAESARSRIHAIGAASLGGIAGRKHESRSAQEPGASRLVGRAALDAGVIALPTERQPETPSRTARPRPLGLSCPDRAALPLPASRPLWLDRPPANTRARARCPSRRRSDCSGVMALLTAVVLEMGDRIAWVPTPTVPNPASVLAGVEFSPRWGTLPISQRADRA